MKQALLLFWKQPAAKIGIVTAVMFQLLFSSIWMTGYKGVSEHADQLRVAVVNEDSGMGAGVAAQLKEHLPFETEIVESNEKATRLLNERDVQMVIRIPADFSKQLQEPGQKAGISYTINESNASMIKSVMQAAAGGATAKANEQAVARAAQAMLSQANPALPNERIQQMAEALSGRVEAQIVSINPVKDTSNQMLPMMLMLASIVGTMIMGMNFYAAQNQAYASGGATRLQKLLVRFVVTVPAAVIIGLIGSGMAIALGGQTVQGYFALWGFQSLFLLTFALVAQMFLSLFGTAGMVLNIAMLSLQLVTSGAIVPRELLSGFYHTLSSGFPGTYAVNGLMNILFGGPGIGAESGMLAAIAAIALALDAAAVFLRRGQAQSGAASQEKAA